MSVGTVERVEVLRHKAEQIEDLVDPARLQEEDAVADRTRPLTAEQRDAWCKTLEDAVLDLCNALPQGVQDYDARKLLEFLLRLREAIAADEEASDERGEIELTTMMMRDVALRISRRLELDELDDPRLAADEIFATLRGVGVSDLSRLLGVSTKTVRSWMAGRPVERNVQRVVLVAHLLTYLRASMTPNGLVMWFDSPREQLGGASPLQLLSEGGAASRETLTPLARAVRGQLAS